MRWAMGGEAPYVVPRFCLSGSQCCLRVVVECLLALTSIAIRPCHPMLCAFHAQPGMDRDERVLMLEVINGTDLLIPSHRIPAGLYVSVSTSSGQWNTTIKAPMADCSVAWNETFIICARPVKSFWWPMAFFSSTSTEVHFEIRASFEIERTLGQGQVVGTVNTTIEKLLEQDEHFRECSLSLMMASSYSSD
ncbi:hypothetical protein DEU56DRAFT_581831 [Suillus clintonianus]|uniref:uncharacterized protein n=1 Tax=Suillus clintonianus TaxID=1904413 RepID=UPI001B881720|nr:uncharacterized protein DEU56DRAFT_581831 [Suillus clintonianus]KAG2150944.1 hypothetical protein DEU56DRAFT_581831 [Suillus clintonianus]